MVEKEKRITPEDVEIVKRKKAIISMNEDGNVEYEMENKLSRSNISESRFSQTNNIHADGSMIKQEVEDYR